jgi:hypothetical protein
MKHGALTVTVARKPSEKLAARGLDVLFDHGDKRIDPKDQVGRIISWFGKYEPQHHLAFLDIAVIWQDSGKVVALIEIEESIATPKVLLGDVFAILLGDGIRFQGKRDLEVDARSVLMVFARAHEYGTKAFQTLHIESRVEALIRTLGTRNAVIGRVALNTFAERQDLEITLMEQIEAALAAWESGADRTTS